MNIVEQVTIATAKMHACGGERMVMKALAREEFAARERIPVCDAEEALCILIERGWTWDQILFVNS